jgi:hypothetical protein
MSTYLGQHPAVFMSDPKEPAFWATDYPRLARVHSIPLATRDDYLRLFRPARPDQSVVGEASTVYLSSASAVPNILSFNPAARFLVMLRNPIDFRHGGCRASGGVAG